MTIIPDPHATDAFLQTLAVASRTYTSHYNYVYVLMSVSDNADIVYHLLLYEHFYKWRGFISHKKIVPASRTATCLPRSLRLSGQPVYKCWIQGGHLRLEQALSTPTRNVDGDSHQCSRSHLITRLDKCITLSL